MIFTLLLGFHTDVRHSGWAHLQVHDLPAQALD